MSITKFYYNFSIALTKLDVLDDLKEIKIGVAYKYNGENLPAFPGMYSLAFVLNY